MDADPAYLKFIVKGGGPKKMDIMYMARDPKYHFISEIAQLYSSTMNAD